jgi:PEP-CTERM motif
LLGNVTEFDKEVVVFKRFAIATSIIISLLIIHNTEAATVLWWDPPLSSSHYAYRIEGLEVLGETYNIDFRLESYNTLWPGGGFDVPTQADAVTVMNAINDALNDEMDAINRFIILEDSTNQSTQTNRYNIPHPGPNTNDVQIAQLLDPRDYTLISPGIELPASSAMYAKMEAVPLPGAVWLLGSGLIGIVGIRRKLNK